MSDTPKLYSKGSLYSVKELRSHLDTFNIPYPSSSTKSTLVGIYTKELAPYKDDPDYLDELRRSGRASTSRDASRTPSPARSRKKAPSVQIPGWIQQLSDPELRQRFKDLNETCGPVTAATRRTLEKKLVRLLEERADLSDSDNDSEEDAPVPKPSRGKRRTTPNRKQQATAPAEIVSSSPDLSSSGRRRLGKKKTPKITSPDSYESKVRRRHTIFSDDEQNEDAGEASFSRSSSSTTRTTTTRSVRARASSSSKDNEDDEETEEGVSTSSLLCRIMLILFFVGILVALYRTGMLDDLQQNLLGGPGAGDGQKQLGDASEAASVGNVQA